MAGRRKFSELRAKMDPERRAQNEEAAQAMLAAMALDELLRERGITQEEVAAQLGKHQPVISRTLRQDDMKVSTLRSLVAAMGGQLEIRARFPDQEIRIRQFDLAES
jgi:transcriptional regulator with XRE-family HTH domain